MLRRIRPLRAPLVVTVAASVLAAHCGGSTATPDASVDGAASVPDAVALDAPAFDAPAFDAPACPPRDTLPINLACAVNGQRCEMRVNGQWCPENFWIPWRCEDNRWREDASWSCNPPPPTDVPRPPSPDRMGVCPTLRPTENAPCEPEAVPDRCVYSALDSACDADRQDIASCSYLARYWHVELASCRRSPCPATPPSDGLPCDFPARDDCDYTISCEGEPAQVRAYCLMTNQWTTRSLCRSWGRDAGAAPDAR